MRLQNFIIKLLTSILILSVNVISQYKSDNITLLSRIGDARNFGLLIENNIAYVGGGCYVYILDISDNAKPILLSKTITLDQIGDIKKVNNHLFIANASAGLTIMDISDLNSPQIVGNCATKTRSYRLCISNNFIFLSDVFYGFIVIDASDIHKPFEVADYYSEGFGEGLRVKNNLLYFCDNYAGLKIFNISNPSNPILLKKYTNVQSAENIIFYKDYDIVLSQYSELYILNSSDINNIIEVSKLSVLGSDRQITQQGDSLYIGGLYSNIKAIDISDVIKPHIVFTYLKSPYISNIEIISNSMFVLNVDTGLEIYDKNSPNRLISSYLLPSYMREFDFYNHFISIAYQYAGVLIYDINNPLQPQYVNMIGNNYSLDSYQQVSNVINIDNISFMLTENSGVHLFDIKDPNNPVFLSRLLTYDGMPIQGSAIAKVKDDIYYLLGDGKISIFNLKDFSNPVFVNSINLEYPQRLLIKDNYAYLTCWSPQSNYSLSIYDVTEAEHPTLKGKIALQSQAYGMDIIDNYIFAACTNGGLNIIDITDKANPFIKNIINNGNNYMSYVSIKNNYAYVTDGINGLLVFDISNIDSIKKVGSLDVGSFTYYVKAYGNEIYVSSFEGGLFILRNDLLTSLTKSNEGDLINSLKVFQNYPNPFNPVTTITFELPNSGYVLLEIYNTLGEKVSTLVNKELGAGLQKISFNASDLPSGIYIYRIVTKNNVVSKKMTLTK